MSGRTGPAPQAANATLSLARVEGRRLLRNPLVLVGVELSFFLHLHAVMSGPMPVVTRDEVALSGTLLPLAAGSMLAANWAALRSRRHGIKELYDTLPMAPGRRTAAHLLSVAAPTGLAALAVGAGLAFMVALGGVGGTRPLELLGGPAVVALGGVLGVLLAYLAPWVGVAPVTAVGLTASWYFPYLWYRITGHVWIWRNFWLFPWFQAPGSPATLTDAFAGGRHLAYVGGLVAVAACLALALSSVHRRSQVRTILAMVLAAALVVVSAAAQASSPAATQEAAKVPGDALASQVCVPRDGVRYCAWPTYLPWVDRWWQRPVAGVLQRLPAAGPGHVPTVRQMDLTPYEECWYQQTRDSGCPERAEILRAFASADVRPGSSWPRGSGQDQAELDLALSTAVWATGLPIVPNPESDVPVVCIPPGQARVVVALWLAVQSTPKAEAGLKARTLGRFPSPRAAAEAQGLDAPPSRFTLGEPNLFVAEWPWQEAAYAVALLEQRPGEVAERLHRDWARWLSRDTPTAELVEALGLPALPTPRGPAHDRMTAAQVLGHKGCD